MESETRHHLPKQTMAGGPCACFSASCQSICKSGEKTCVSGSPKVLVYNLLKTHQTLRGEGGGCSRNQQFNELHKWILLPSKAGEHNKHQEANNPRGPQAGSFPSPPDPSPSVSWLFLSYHLGPQGGVFQVTASHL